MCDNFGKKLAKELSDVITAYCFGKQCGVELFMSASDVLDKYKDDVRKHVVQTKSYDDDETINVMVRTIKTEPVDPAENESDEEIDELLKAACTPFTPLPFTPLKASDVPLLDNGYNAVSQAASFETPASQFSHEKLGGKERMSYESIKRRRDLRKKFARAYRRQYHSYH